MFQEQYGKLFGVLIAAALCIPPIYLFYRSGPRLVPDKITSKEQIGNYAFWILCVVICGLIFNVILYYSGIAEFSEGFNRTNETLHDGSLLIKILCNCLVIPILEELLMRGIVTGRLCIWYGMFPAILISSICFGIIHNNIVQFIYAFIIGIGLALMYCRTKRLSLCIITHCIMNFIITIFT